MNLRLLEGSWLICSRELENALLPLSKNNFKIPLSSKLPPAVLVLADGKTFKGT
jgi:hypothetical protein